MYYTLRRLYKNSYNEEAETYNELILIRAVEFKWITEEQRQSIIDEVTVQ